MATVKIEKFCGLQPRVNAAMLADGMATVAHNCRLKSGKLVPLREPLPVTGAMVRYENGLGAIKEARSLWAWKQTDADGQTNVEFIAYPGQVWFADSNLGDDKQDRLFVSGDTGVEWTERVEPYQDAQGRTVTTKVWHDAPFVFMHDRDARSVTRLVLCKNPLSRVLVSLADVAGEPQKVDRDKDVKYTYFFVTWVDAYGYESGVSPASYARNGDESGYSDQTLEYNDGQTVAFAFEDASTIPQDAVAVRVYKVVSGSESQAIQFIKEVTPLQAQSGFTVKVLDADAGESLPQLESPPGDLSGIVRMPGNYYAGFIRSAPKSVAFSEIDIPTSWPYDYRYDVEDNVVCLAATVNTLFVLTDGRVYVLSGTAPEAMTISKLADSAACLSARSVCVHQNAVYFASNDGLYMIYADADYGMLCKNITEKMMTREQWQDYNPASCVMQEMDGELHLFFEKVVGGAVRRTNLNVNLNETMNAITTSDEVASCACKDGRTGKMYYVRSMEA